MESTMFLKFAGDAVFTANGVFLENNSCIRYKHKEAVYVTVFPLNPALLPYTVKFTGCEAFPDCGLERVVTLCQNRYLALFSQRYSYVFSQNRCFPSDCNPADRFFCSVKAGDTQKARSFMTRELSSSVGDDALAEFFAPYKAIVKDERFLSEGDGAFLLIDEKNDAHPVTLSLKNNLIDDITQNDA